MGTFNLYRLAVAVEENARKEFDGARLSDSAAMYQSAQRLRRARRAKHRAAERAARRGERYRELAESVLARATPQARRLAPLIAASAESFRAEHHIERAKLEAFLIGAFVLYDERRRGVK